MNLFEDKSYLASRFSFFGMGAQALTGIVFDQEAARALVSRIETEMKEIADEVEPKLPPRKLKKSEEGAYTVPAKPFKKDGTISAHMEKFLERHGCKMEPNGQSFQWLDGTWHTVTAGFIMPATAPMLLANQDDLKAWFLEIGWEPTLWNYKKDERGKPIKDKKTGEYIKTSPKMQEAGRLCPNLESLNGELVRPVLRWLSLRNRLSVVSGWLDNPRLAYDGKLSADSAGITNTFRQRHVTVVNVPKAEDGVVLGREMRALFTARPGRVLVGYDAVAIENRVEAHFVYPYPGGAEYAEEILSGDPHKKNAFFAFYTEELEALGLDYETTDKDLPAFKPFRSKSKNGKYALSYGASPPKLAKTLGLPEYKGDAIYERFWNANEPLKLLREAVTEWWEQRGQKKFIKGIDGRRLPTRSKHSLVNTLFQSTGAIIMDYSAMFMDKWLGGLSVDSQNYPCYHYKGHVIYRVLYQHDEYGWDCPPEIAEEVGRMGCKSIGMAGKYLKMRVPFGGEAKIGTNWKETH